MKELQMYRYVLTALAAVIFTTTYFIKNPNVETQIVERHTVQIKIETPANIIDYDEMECLALNIYHEARGEGTPGQVAVSQVVLNRVKSSYFPNTVCGVIKQARVSKWYLEHQNRIVPLRNQCQFSWYCDGKSDEPRDMRAWGQALTVASEVMRGNYPDLTKGAMFYHANYVDPYWNTSMMHVAYIGEHLFYKHPKY